MPTIYQQIFFGKARLSHVFSVVVLSVLTCLSGQVLAIQASPHPIDEIQPDGSKIRLFVRGDEHFNWYEDENGFTVLRDRATRRYVYAELGASQRLQKTDAIVGATGESRADAGNPATPCGVARVASQRPPYSHLG